MNKIDKNLYEENEKIIKQFLSKKFYKIGGGFSKNQIISLAILKTLYDKYNISQDQTTKEMLIDLLSFNVLSKDQAKEFIEFFIRNGIK